MRHVRTRAEFERLWDESPALVCDFSAAWCGPCKKLEPVLRSLEATYPGIVFAKVDTGEHKRLSRCLEIRCVPTVFLVKKGELVRRLVGHEIFASLSEYVKELLDE